MHPDTARKRTSDRLSNERVHVCGGPSYGDKLQDGETIDSHHANSLTHTGIESRNHLKTPGRSFHQQQSISRPPGNRP